MRHKQKNILYLLHLTPPVYESVTVGEFVKASEVINNTFNGRYMNLLLSRSVKEVGKISATKFYRGVITWFKLLGKIINRKPNLCYYTLSTTGAALYKDCVLVGLLRVFQIKTIFHLHNKGVRRNQNKKINNLMYRFLFKNSNVILVSEQLYLDVEKYVSPWKVYYCHNGIKDYQIETKLLAISDNKTFKILYVSDLIKAKGVFELIDACSVLKENGRIFKCDFMGGEGDVNREQFESYVKKKGLTEYVKYHGRRFGKLKEVAYEKADVFVLPTYYPNESFPLVILEAMQHGLPVISTYEGAIPDMIKDGITGFLVPQQNVTALAERLNLLARYPGLRKQMGEEGRMKYENDFSLKVFENNLLTILQDAVKS